MKSLLLLVIALVNYIGFSQCDEQSLIILETRAKDTDTNIDWEINKHFSFYNPSCDERGFLVVHLVGSYDNPTNNIMFPSVAANNGFHVISLKYPNSTAAQSACGGSTDTDCYFNFRKEIIEGGDFSPDVIVDVNNSVENRLLKLLQHLNINNPSESWDNYFSGDIINWNKLIVSGHSQGGGHAAYIGMQHQVKRVLMFASPNDYNAYYNAPADWTNSSHLTPSSDYYGLNNLYDDVVDFSDQFQIWNNLGMPLSGDSLTVDNINNYNTSHQLYTTVTGPDANQNHSLMIRDDQTILDGNGKSIFEPVWGYMLGIDIGLSVDKFDTENTTISLYPNPFKKTFSIKIDKSLPDNCDISIYSIQGELIFKQEIESNLIKLDLSHLPNGLYFIQILDNTKSIYSGKFQKLD